LSYRYKVEYAFRACFYDLITFLTFYQICETYFLPLQFEEDTIFPSLLLSFGTLSFGIRRLGSRTGPHSRERCIKTRIETKKPWQFSLQPLTRCQLPDTKVYIIALAASRLALCFFPAWPVLVEEPKVQVQVKIGLLVEPSISKQ